jgi:hypothetical protein
MPAHRLNALMNVLKNLIGLPPKRLGQAATFVQEDKNNPFKHHDAFQFADGKVVLVHDLKPDQMLTVLTLPAPPKNEKEREEQTRAAYV